jgi:hypothetical protein
VRESARDEPPVGVARARRCREPRRPARDRRTALRHQPRAGSHGPATAEVLDWRQPSRAAPPNRKPKPNCATRDGRSAPLGRRLSGSAVYPTAPDRILRADSITTSTAISASPSESCLLTAVSLAGLGRAPFGAARVEASPTRAVPLLHSVCPHQAKEKHHATERRPQARR